MLSDLIQVVTRVVRALEGVGVPYVVGGSLASSQYGIPRSTNDVDLLADLRQQCIAPLVDALQDEFYVDAHMISEAIQHSSSFNLIHLETMYKVDIFLPQDHSWAEEELARRKAETSSFDDSIVVFYYSSPEDNILHKLDWYRQGAGISDRQWNDVLGVLKAQAGKLDAAYLRHWAGELGLGDLLDQALREAGGTL